MQAIPIFFSVNDNYVPIMSVMIQSIMENAQRERNYDFYILHKDIKTETMEILQKQIELFSDFSIKFVDMSTYVKDYKFFVSRHVTVETYFRLFIPYAFPDLKKIIYLDGDMICLTDVSELFDADVKDYLIGGVRDIGVAWYFLPKKQQDDKFRKIYEYILSMENPTNYINAGMLLINCEKFRETYSQKDIVDTIFSREWQVHDQDVINFLAKDKILHLDYEWDFMPNGWAKYLPQNLKNKYIEAEKNPKIIHYKPYACWYYVPHFYEFWKYATRTPFVKEIVARTNKDNLIDKELQDKICITIRETTSFSGVAIMKAVLAFFCSKYSSKLPLKQKKK